MNYVIVPGIKSAHLFMLCDKQERQWRGGVNKWRQERDKKDVADHHMHTTKGGSMCKCVVIGMPT